ncbi:EamA family transporter [Xanthobacter sp. V2C-8]|uniref:EamA family transporter n=1 Tax=Xanthobacter albus TaxID=3119929 RepID=UPI003728C5A3
MTGLSVSVRLAALLLAFLGVDTATQVAFKLAADGIGDVPLGLGFAAAMAGSAAAWLAVAFYIATYVLWMLVLKDTALSRAFPLTALSYVTVPLIGWLAFGEAIGPRVAAGIALILAGVALVGAAPEAGARGLSQREELRPCRNGQWKS